MLTDPSQGWGALDYTWHCAARLLHELHHQPHDHVSRVGVARDRGRVRWAAARRGGAWPDPLSPDVVVHHLCRARELCEEARVVHGDDRVAGQRRA